MAEGGEEEGKTPALLGFLHRSFRTLPAKAALAAPEGLLELSRDLRADEPALALLRKSLFEDGFAAAPCSERLVDTVRHLDREQLQGAGAAFRACVGRSSEWLQAQGGPVGALVLESLAQLRAVLPSGAVVLGALEGSYRGPRGGIGWLHLDELRTSPVYREQALMGVEGDEGDEGVGAGGRLEELLRELRAGAQLPAPALEACGDGREAARALLAAAEAAGLVPDVVNVWVPRRSKRLLLLPFGHSRGRLYERDTRPSVEEVEEEDWSERLRVFGEGRALLFFGRYVLHQAAAGEAFPQCWEGSMETRYLVLLPRREVHRFWREEEGPEAL